MKNKKPLLDAIKFGGVLLLFFNFILFAQVFYSAYNSDTKRAVVDINSFNEAELEYWVILPFNFLIALFVVFLTFRDGLPSKEKIEENLK